MPNDFPASSAKPRTRLTEPLEHRTDLRARTGERRRRSGEDRRQPARSRVASRKHASVNPIVAVVGVEARSAFSTSGTRVCSSRVLLRRRLRPPRRHRRPEVFDERGWLRHLPLLLQVQAFLPLSLFAKGPRSDWNTDSVARWQMDPVRHATRGRKARGVAEADRLGHRAADSRYREHQRRPLVTRQPTARDALRRNPAHLRPGEWFIARARSGRCTEGRKLESRWCAHLGTSP